MQPPPSEHADLSSLLHVLRAHGLTSHFPTNHLPSSDAILQLLTNQLRAQEYFGHTLVIQTRHGLRYPTLTPLTRDPWRETHRDQVLASLAELGMALDYPLVLRDQDYPLREVLRDSIANFHLKQAELTWTALAYALYLPPVHTWLNRYGESTTFDHLATDLLARPLNRSSCGGAHLVYTIIIILRVDMMETILSDTVRASLLQRLRQVLKVIQSTQEADGSWPIDWNRVLCPSPYTTAFSPDSKNAHLRLLATSHLAECLLYLPNELQDKATAKSLRRARHWLLTQLRTASPDDVTDNLCPYSHALCVLR